MEKLKYTYCSGVGVEFMHMQDVTRKNWVQKKVEERKRVISKEKKMQVLNWLTKGDKFEAYLAKKYPFTKRFGLEGAESLIPALEAILEKATEMVCTLGTGLIFVGSRGCRSRNATSWSLERLGQHYEETHVQDVCGV